MAQQTAVEWLIEQIKSDQNQKALSPSEWMQVIEQTKAMERKQRIEDYNAGYDDAQCNHINDAENYINESEYIRLSKDGDKDKNISSNQSTTYDVNVKYNTK